MEDFSFFENFDDAIIKLDFLKILNSNEVARSLGFFEGNDILSVFTFEKVDVVVEKIIKKENFMIEDKFYFFYLSDERYVRLKYFNGFIYIKDLTDEMRINEAKVNFTTSVSHELFTPLSVIKGNLYLLRDTFGDIEPLEQMEHAIKRMERIIKQLKIIAMLELGMYTPQKNVVDVEKILKEILEEFSERINKKRLSFEISVFQKEFFNDSFMLYTILKNIISNSIKYSYEDSKIYITVEKDKIRVKDRGIGIKKEEVEKVTERFYRSKDAIKMAYGSGLGLSIVKHICKILNCELKINSDYLIGTEVIICFE
ncbi:histidine kinase [Thermosipho affectus]|uniref:histidine kinase n=1 Tax=Thermosipho affectus TaxID=660294 RepID=A0ABX3IJB6_9BACT|nr:HAMP domain-containing sensor histidine kinase [Thermosipho affectus]ONN27921.1 histidine kinase [Thermosipho affectus]